VPDRRQVLAMLSAALAVSCGGAAHADATDEEAVANKELVKEVVDKTKPAAPGMSVYFGLASPPTSYGGYGGNAAEDAKYYFSYPSEWKVETVNKVKKGMQGIDAILYEKKGKGYPGVFVVTFSRAGEDNKSFKLANVETTFQGFAGADYDLQDALTESTDTKQSQREIDGQTYFDYEIFSPVNNYLATITVQTGKVFALFVKAPPKKFDQQEQQLRTVQQSFRTIPIVYKKSSGQV
jgi:hypothetical protein